MGLDEVDEVGPGHSPSPARPPHPPPSSFPSFFLLLPPPSPSSPLSPPLMAGDVCSGLGCHRRWAGTRQRGWCWSAPRCPLPQHRAGGGEGTVVEGGIGEVRGCDVGGRRLCLPCVGWGGGWGWRGAGWGWRGLPGNGGWRGGMVEEEEEGGDVGGVVEEGGAEAWAVDDRRWVKGEARGGAEWVGEGREEVEAGALLGGGGVGGGAG